ACIAPRGVLVVTVILRPGDRVVAIDLGVATELVGHQIGGFTAPSIVAHAFSHGARPPDGVRERMVERLQSLARARVGPELLAEPHAQLLPQAAGRPDEAIREDP